MTNDKKNDQFEALMIKTLKENLCPSKDVYRYASVALDQLFINDVYQTQDGTRYYFEIPGHHCWHKRPIIVKL